MITLLNGAPASLISFRFWNISCFLVSSFNVMSNGLSWSSFTFQSLIALSIRSWLKLILHMFFIIPQLSSHPLFSFLLVHFSLTLESKDNDILSSVLSIPFLTVPILEWFFYFLLHSSFLCCISYVSPCSSFPIVLLYFFDFVSFSSTLFCSFSRSMISAFFCRFASSVFVLWFTFSVFSLHQSF